MHCNAISLSSILLMHYLLISSQSVAAADWNYEDNGYGWPQQFPQFCSGRRQSPVDLGTFHSQVDSDLRPFQFTESASSAYTLTAINNGHSLMLTWSEGNSIEMKIPDSKVIYKAAQLHWHWGSKDSTGSEHTVDKIYYAAEAHLVFYNSFDYANLSDAASKVGGLAVIGVFLQASNDDNPLIDSIETLIRNTTLQNAEGQVSMTVQPNTMSITDLLLPSNKNDFYRYDGSLTTPPCYETVLWTVLRQPMPISRKQLAIMRNLKFSDNSQMVDNYRKVQPLNSDSRPGTKRILFRSFNSAQSMSSVVSFVISAALATVVVSAQ